MPRVIAWFSCGVASAVAAKLTLDKYPNAIVARCIVNNEHEDNERFSNDVSTWLNVPILKLQSDKYMDCWQVWEERRYLNGPAGALCTVEMKKFVRRDFQLPDDIQIFGFTSEETERAKRFQENNLEVIAQFPLIERGYSKDDCFKIFAAEQIEIPMMYRLGFGNANCVGCVKGGMGYWNKIRQDFPLVFRRMERLERRLDASCIKNQFLDELDPSKGRFTPITLPECGLFCESEPDPLDF